MINLKDFDPNGASNPSNNIYGFPITEDEAQLVILPVPWEVTVSYSAGTARAAAAGALGGRADEHLRPGGRGRTRGAGRQSARPEAADRLAARAANRGASERSTGQAHPNGRARKARSSSRRRARAPRARTGRRPARKPSRTRGPRTRARPTPPPPAESPTLPGRRNCTSASRHEAALRRASCPAAPAPAAHASTRRCTSPCAAIRK